MINSQSEQDLINKKIFMVKELWINSQVEEETWKTKLEMKKKHPKLFLKAGMEIQISMMKFC